MRICQCVCISQALRLHSEMGVRIKIRRCRGVAINSLGLHPAMGVWTKITKPVQKRRTKRLKRFLRLAIRNSGTEFSVFCIADVRKQNGAHVLK